MRKDDIIREVEVYTVLFNPRKKSFEILNSSPDKTKHMYNFSNRLRDSNIRI